MGFSEGILGAHHTVGCVWTQTQINFTNSDWQKVIIIWAKDPGNTGQPSQFLLSQQAGYDRKKWGDIPNAFSTIEATLPRSGENGRKNLDHPKVYVAWSKQAVYHDKNTGWNEVLSQLTNNASRSQDWWHYHTSSKSHPPEFYLYKIENIDKRPLYTTLLSPKEIIREIKGIKTRFGNGASVLKTSPAPASSTIAVVCAKGDDNAFPRFLDCLRRMHYNHWADTARVQFHNNRLARIAYITVDDPNFAKIFDSPAGGECQGESRREITSPSPREPRVVREQQNLRSSLLESHCQKASKFVILGWENATRAVMIEFDHHMVAKNMACIFSQGKYKILGVRISLLSVDGSIVHLKGVPASATVSDIIASIRGTARPSKIRLGPSSYTQNTNSHIREMDDILREYGPLESPLTICPFDGTPGTIRATASFVHEADAARAVAECDEMRLPFWLSGRLTIFPLYRVYLDVLQSVYDKNPVHQWFDSATTRVEGMTLVNYPEIGTSRIMLQSSNPQRLVFGTQQVEDVYKDQTLRRPPTASFPINLPRKHSHQTEPTSACHICLNIPLLTVTAYCGHVFCPDCFTSFAMSAVESRNAQDTKTRCFGGEDAACTHVFSLQELKDNLTMTNFEKVLELALVTHAARNPATFKACPGPDCDRIHVKPPVAAAPPKRTYRDALMLTTRTTRLTCSSCDFNFCGECYTAHGEHLSCSEAEAERAWELQAAGLGIKRCGYCTAPIEKSDGCQHVICRCGRHICWVCMEDFQGVDECYDHLQAAHGGIFAGLDEYEDESEEYDTMDEE
ncbi:hypothetical protein CORC01_13741 [Colletotrichum orchidophilum]|uniref:RBR-type E3 ubiquitin transferase n=1 Tax=Colletotrichum orchidophilum TaxID=1209926 RepID=A0A1G4AP61_9PEZI|nr:uncharacterized protein CORC01_13741 [Colletotrichum orchidophilum]OHE90964.1 hypothetical protein CORC01_13741 [Colletotrichum orchidophilum]